MKYDITMITPTHNRPVALQLCSQWLLRQEFDGRAQWIISDDGNDKAEIFKSVSCRYDVIHLNRQRLPDEINARSLAANVLYALPHVQSDKIIMIEDDDYYAPNHIAELMCRLEYADIAGTIWQMYYHLPTQRYKIFKNIGSALCSTGFRISLLPNMIRNCIECYYNNDKGLDRRFWDNTKQFMRDIYDPIKQTCIGIKGLPGQIGIGVGHRPNDSYTTDANGDKLREWVGEDAYKQYREIAYG